jgi:hypothetical protein
MNVENKIDWLENRYNKRELIIDYQTRLGFNMICCAHKFVYLLGLRKRTNSEQPFNTVEVFIQKKWIYLGSASRHTKHLLHVHQKGVL